MEAKKCHNCGITKPLSDFPKDKKSKGGYRHKCKSCRAKDKMANVARRQDELEAKRRAATAADQPKTCSGCNAAKPRTEFNRSKSTPDGLQNYCRDCQARKGVQHREDNVDAIKAYQQAYEASPRGRERQRTHYRRHREQRIADAAAWNRANPEAHNAAGRRSDKKNRPRIRAYFREKYATDIQFRLGMRLRVRLSGAVRQQIGAGVGKKGASAVRDLGCTLGELMVHLEARFSEGMSWDNYGEWHIDHIRPLVSFDLTDSEQCKVACHFTNLQPLWGPENLSKGAT